MAVDTSSITTDVDLLVKREQAWPLAQGLNVTLLANSFVAVAASGILWTQISKTVLLIFLVTISIANLLRAAVNVWARRTDQISTNPDLYLKLSATGALLSGLAWCNFVGMIEFGQAINPAIPLVICGLTAGATVNSPTHAPTVWALIIPVLVALVIGLVFNASFQNLILASLVVVYMGMLCRASAAASAAFRASARLKFEATDLAESLKSANDAATIAVKGLEYIANHDPLTGLSSRSAFKAQFDQLLETARLNHSEVALMLIDLDRFKAINDTFGHAAGDRVLIEVARRMREAVGNDSLGARLGGDEFAVILQSQQSEQSIVDLAGIIVDSICRPITANDRQLSVGASIGYALYPRDGFSAEELQTSADLALYAAKLGGRGLVRGFDEKLRSATDARRVFELDLGDAIADGSLEVWFQPQVRISDHRLVGVESLLRWHHPNHGWVSPPEIVAAAAATRQSEALTGFVIAASCRMIRALSFAGRDDVSVSFNVSPQELGRYSLHDLIARTIAGQDVPPERLEVEITEESMLSEERGGADLRSIADMGVKIAIDDFGVGYSSFGALRNLKFDCIKIDRIFVEGLTRGDDDRALVQAILGVTRALGVKAIAEGVETAEQLAVLASLGCNEVQGYLFARPMAANNLLDWLVAHGDDAPSTSATILDLPGLGAGRFPAAKPVASVSAV